MTNYQKHRKEIHLKGNLATHLVVFALGILSAYLVFHKTGNFNTNNNQDIDPSSDFIDNLSNQPVLNSDNLCQNNQQIIDDQNNEITGLKSQLSSLLQTTQENVQIDADPTPTKQNSGSEDQQAQSLKKMTFKDFENSMKESFTERFKGVVIELSGEKLNDIKNAFSQSQNTDNKSVQYENSISNFLAENNTNGDHFIQSLRCNTHICRLEVNTNNNESWNTVYASMTQQSWYESITVQEASEYPGNIIYYLPNINN